jgi:hypothetical protein
MIALLSLKKLRAGRASLAQPPTVGFRQRCWAEALPILHQQRQQIRLEKQPPERITPPGLPAPDMLRRATSTLRGHIWTEVAHVRARTCASARGGAAIASRAAARSDMESEPVRILSGGRRS